MNESLLCAAVLRTRQVLNMSQASFAAQIGITVVTLFKWERSRNKPSKPEALLRLRDAAGVAGLSAEQQLFDDALPPYLIEGVDWRIQERILQTVGNAALILRLGSVAEWYYMLAFRSAPPEVQNALNEVLLPVIELVKEIVREQAPADGKLDIAFFNWLTFRADELVARKLLRTDDLTSLRTGSYICKLNQRGCKQCAEKKGLPRRLGC
jgi:transcriptional regulator with XRE-family HTH domain